MINKRSKHSYQRLGHWLAAALTGQTGLPVTITVYAVIAVLLLVYVSAQVYTGVLTQEITALHEERVRRTESLNKLTAQYVTLSSRTRVGAYCENVLGMRQASEDDCQRFAVGEETAFKKLVEFAQHSDPLRDTYRFSTLHRVNEKSDG